MKIWRALFLAIALLLFNFQILYAVEEEAAGNCQNIGNNLATPVGDTTEANYTLISLEQNGSNRDEVAKAINSGKEVIVRLGVRAGEDKSNDNFLDSLAYLRQNTDSKHFIVTAGHNEANCGEYVDINIELAFAQKITGQNLNNVTYITGQIDFYCGASPGLKPKDYAERLILEVGGLSGLSLPFYIGDVGPKDEVLTKFNKMVDVAGGKDIYITESGPYKSGTATPSREEFLAYAEGVSQIMANPQVKTLLLFNALGLNQQAEFAYTKYFKNSACRAAFRSSCSNPEKVTTVCYEGGAGDYYLEPIKGLIEQNAEAMFHDLQRQGYQVQCTAPTLLLQYSDSSFGAPKELLADENFRQTIHELTATQYFDYIDSQIPIWRQQGIYVLKDKDSLEAFWSHKDTETELIDSITQGTKNSAVYNLLDLKTQCVQQVKMLSAIQAKCHNLKTDDGQMEACPLNIAIEKTNFTALQLLQKIKDLANIPEREYQKEKPVSDAEAITICNKLNNPNDNFYTQNKIKEGLSNTPLLMSNAYRYAFLVLSGQLFNDSTPSWQAPFNFLRDSDKSANPRHEVRIIAFKIPDFATNKDETSTGYFQDALQLTRDAVSRLQNQKTLVDDNKAAYFDKFKTLPEVQALRSSRRVISCGSAGACAQPAVRAIVDYIDAAPGSLLCARVEEETLNYEPSEQIYSSGEISSGDGTSHKVFDKENQNEIDLGDQKAQDSVDSLAQQWIGQKFEDFKTAVLDQVAQVPPFKFLSQYRIDYQEHFGKSGEIYAYLVVPYGYDLQTTEAVLGGLLANYNADYGNALNKFIETKNSPKYFKINSDDQLQWAEGSKAGAGGWTDAECLANLPAGADPSQCDRKIEISLKSEQEGLEPRLPGAILGKVTLWLQKAISGSQSKMHRIITTIENSSQKPTEDFLLGMKNAGKASDSAAAECGPSQINPDCQSGDLKNSTCGLEMCESTQECQIADSMSGKTGKKPLFQKNLLIDWLNTKETVDCAQLANVHSEGDRPVQIQYCETIKEKAAARGINPRFAIAMWGEESWFSSISQAADFGVISKENSTQTGSILTQLNAFLDMAAAHKDQAENGYIQLLLRYSGEEGWRDWNGGEASFCNNREFPARLKSIYEQLGQL